MKKSVTLSTTERIKYSTNFLVKQESSYHIFFWLSLFIILLLLDNQNSIGIRVIKQFINVAFFALIAYINLIFLFPNYLKNKNLIIHLLMVVIVAVLITPIKTALLYLILPNTTALKPYLMDNMLSIFFATTFIGLATSQYGILTEWMSSQNRQRELKKEKLESELKFLKTQLNPHFLFNTLNSLYALTLKKSELAPEIVLKLSEAMRYMLYECNVDRVPLKNEIKYIENYLELEKLRHSDNVHITFNVTGEVKDQTISPLIFLPFIENSFKHGLEVNVGENYVHINLDVEGEDIRFEVLNKKSNNLKPVKTDKVSGGIGLKNIKKRLELIYPKQYDLRIDNMPEQYKVVLKLNMK